VGEEWWNNRVENVRFNLCDTSFRADGVGGASVNNIFDHCYSNNPLTLGYRINAFKNTVWLNCNFGGNPQFNTRYLWFGTNCYNMKVIGCNFEGATIADGDAGIVIWSRSTVSFDSCNFFANKTGGTTSFEIQARENSVVSIKDCRTINQGEGMRGVNAINSAKVIVWNSPGMDNIQSFSSIPPVRVDELIDKVENGIIVKEIGGGVYEAGQLIPVNATGYSHVVVWM